MSLKPFVSVAAIGLAVLGLLAHAKAAGSESSAGAWIRWRVTNMRYCGGKPDRVVFDGKKSVVALSKDNPCVLAHTIRYADLDKDTFVLKLGKVSQGVSWEVTVVAPHSEKARRRLVSGKGGGTHREPLSSAGLPRWLSADVELRLTSDTPGTAEILAWEIESPGPDPDAEMRAGAYRQLARANPLERGLVPHWSSSMGSFVCAFNATHPEHYNFWLEDEGEALWSLGNYPRMMKLYGRGLRDFIVKHCKNGAPVRRVNDQPLLLHKPSSVGKFTLDTGLLVVDGDLSKDPHINLHHGTYETGGLLARITGFYVTYEDAQGVERRVDFTTPGSYDVACDAPKRDAARLTIRAADARVAAEFSAVVYRGGLSIDATVTNRGGEEIGRAIAGFELADCDKYYRSPLNSRKQLGDVAVLWSEQPRLEFCNIVRLKGPAAKNLSVERKDGNITVARVFAELEDRVGGTVSGSGTLAYVQAGSRCFADKIGIYEQNAFDDADISMSFVNTYPLLGLATWCYRFPNDRDARRAVDLMIDNFLGARERLRNRELGYLIWVLDLLGRDADAAAIADLVEKRAASETYTPHDMAGMAIGLRRAGRWQAADRVCEALDKAWTGVAQPADYLGLGATHSPQLTTRCLRQLSAGLRSMVWDSPDRLTFHSNPSVEEAASEAQSYMLVAYDLMSRQYGGIVPVRLGSGPDTEMTRIGFDAKSGECRIRLSKAGEIDLFTSYRRPTGVLWNGKPLDPRMWRYDVRTGTVLLTGLSGDGELAVRVSGPRPKDKWTPIDYIGLSKRR